MSPTLVMTSSFENALTAQGALDLWTNGFIGGAPLPDTAAVFDGSSPLLSSTPLSALSLGDLDIDPASVTSITGNLQVSQPQGTGLVVVSWSVTMPISPATQPTGACMYNKASGHLFYVSAFPNLPATIVNQFVWNGKITLSVCQNS